MGVERIMERAIDRGGTLGPNFSTEATSSHLLAQSRLKARLNRMEIGSHGGDYAPAARPGSHPCEARVP